MRTWEGREDREGGGREVGKEGCEEEYKERVGREEVEREKGGRG